MTDRPSDEERADIEERVICEQPPQLKPSVPEVKTEEAQPSPSQYPKRGKRAQTNLDLVPIESSHVQHKYLVRRPRALQVRYHGRLIEGGDRGVHTGLIQEVDAEIRQQIPQTNGHRGSATTSESGHAQERSTDDLKVQRERLDLFIDLLWVGIISNISEHFFEQSFSGGVESGRALIEFFLLFLPAWGIWSELQMFLSSYYMDDFAQRLIVMWILILGLFWGNNAPYILGTNETVSWFISVYIIATLSLRLVELLYSIWLPWLRRIWLWRAILTLPVTGFWLAAIFTKHDIQLGMIFATIAFERAWIFLEASPIGDRLWGGNNHIRKYHDYKHTIKRFESFFIITLGEGVFLLVRGSPLGSGFNQHASRGVWALMIYYLVHWTYFYGDHTRTLVHPVYRRWYLRVAWTFLHIPLFMSTVLLSSSMLYLVDYTKEGETNGTAEGAAVRVKRAESSTCPMGGTETAGGRGEKRIERRAEGEACTNHHTLRIATVTAFMSLAVILFTQTALALLNKPLDKPKTLLVNSRYIRLAPRVLAVVALFVMWVCDWQDPNAIIGFMALVCWLVFAWEANVGRERGGGIFEPKLSGRE